MVRCGAAGSMPSRMLAANAAKFASDLAGHRGQVSPLPPVHLIRSAAREVRDGGGLVLMVDRIEPRKRGLLRDSIQRRGRGLGALLTRQRLKRDNRRESHSWPVGSSIETVTLLPARQPLALPGSGQTSTRLRCSGVMNLMSQRCRCSHRPRGVTQNGTGRFERSACRPRDDLSGRGDC